MYDRVEYIKNHVGCSWTSLFDGSIEGRVLGFSQFYCMFVLFHGFLKFKKAHSDKKKG